MSTFGRFRCKKCGCNNVLATYLFELTFCKGDQEESDNISGSPIRLVCTHCSNGWRDVGMSHGVLLTLFEVVEG